MAEVTPHSPAVVVALAAFKRAEEDALQAWAEVLKTPEMFSLDLLANGSTKRFLSVASGLRSMIESRNMGCARGLLRMHIDTALRFAAAWHVDKPHDFSHDVLKGAHIRSIKDRHGEKLTDRRLVELFTPDHPWLPKVYESLSGYVHLSGDHISSAVIKISDDGRFQMLISASDEHLPDFSWLEIIDCFKEASEIFLRHLKGYALTKAKVKAGELPPGDE